MAHLAGIGEDAATEVERLAPDWITRSSKWAITGGVRIRNGRPEGFVDVRSSFWHIPEFGTARLSAKPYLRPGAARALNKHNGTFKGTNR